MLLIELRIGVHCAHKYPYLAFGRILVGKPELVCNLDDGALIVQDLAEVRERGIESDVLVAVGRALRENHCLGG